MTNPPYSYRQINVAAGTTSPSTVHVRNTALHSFFERYLLQKAMSVFRWKMPLNWAKNYFLYGLFYWGYVGIVPTQKFGIIPQLGGVGGYNVFMQPSEFIVANPILPEISRPFTIGVDCEIIRLAPDWMGISDLVSYYADQLAIASEAAGMNMLNSKLSYVFAAGNKAAAEAFKKLYDQIQQGDPAVVLDTRLKTPDGKNAWEAFSQNVGQNYIATKIFDDMRALENQFCTEIGIPNANITKRERLTTDEVNANNVETFSRSGMWLEQLQDDCKRVRKMFPDLEISVDWRYANDERNNEPVGTVDGE